MDALVVAPTEKSFVSIVQVLRMCGNYGILKATDINQARYLTGMRDIRIAVIYAETDDAKWREYAENLADSGVGTVFLPAKGADDLAAQLCDSGVQILGRPITRSALYIALRTAAGVSRMYAKLRQENARLNEKINTLKEVCRAKCYLVAEGMTEDEAHKLLEKRAMEERKTLYEIAGDIVLQKERQ